MSSPRRFMPGIGGTVVVLAVSALARGPIPPQPRLSWSVSTAVATAGESVDVSISAFSGRGAKCNVLVGAYGSSIPDFPCGITPARATIGIPDRLTAASSLSLILSVCLPGTTPDVKFDCFSYEKPLRIVVGIPTPAGEDARRSGPSAAASASAPTAPAKPAPEEAAPIGGAPTLLRGEQDASPRQKRAIDGDLLAKLQNKPRKGREVRDIYGRVYRIADPAADSVKAKDDRYRLALMKDETVRKAYDNWGSLDQEGKRAAMQRVCDIQAEVYGTKPVPVEIAPLAAKTRLAQYSPAKHNLTIDPDKCFRSRELAFNAITHESRHSYQHQLVERLDSGQLARTSEEASLGAAFKDGFANYCCSTAGCARSCDYPTYRGQLVERDAFEQGESATRYLGDETSRATYDEYLNGGEGGRKSYAP